MVSTVVDIPEDNTSTSGRLIKRTNYRWNHATGNPIAVEYQTQGEQGQSDQFTHRFTYDRNAQLKYVETSRNGVVWERDAAYDYDRLGRVRQVSSLVNSNGTWTSDGQGGWSAFYVYDQNSSKTRIECWGKLDGVTSSLYDDATITTQSPTSNVVDAVVDVGTEVVAGYTDLRDQTPANTAVDASHLSDFDIGLASPSLLDKAKALGIPLRSRGTRTGPLNTDQLEALGLDGVASQMSSRAGREVSFMIYGTVEAATNRSPSILVPR